MMSYFATKDETFPQSVPGHTAYTLLTDVNGCTNGCIAGISIYPDTTYHTPGCHEDQEVFTVLSGSGWAKVGDEEQSIEPGTAFIAPKGIEHAIKSASDQTPLTVFWFRAAV